MNMKVSDMIKISLFPAMIVATLWIQIPLPGGIAPITLQTLLVLVAGLYLGVKNATISMELYVLMGAIGLPVFAGTGGYQGGFGVIMGPTGGFLIGFIIVAFVVGALKEIVRELTFKNALIISFIGGVIIYLVGIPWMMTALELDFRAVLLMNAPYFPGDILKVIIAAMIGYRLEEMHF